MQALRHAALQLMETAKSRYGSANPFFWGAFVYLGAPQPIRDNRMDSLWFGQSDRINALALQTALKLAA